MATFTDFDLLPSLQGTLAAQGLTTPTEVQIRAIPELLVGRPLVAVAETGSGKTLGYVLPTLHLLKAAEAAGSPVTAGASPRALVLLPNRDLGEQVARVFKGFTHDTRLRVRAALGGSAREVARRNVSGPFEVLIATPGRLLQLLDSDAVNLGDVRILVFDEADQMLDPTFLPDAARIAQATSPHHQLALFSATIPAALETLIGTLFRHPPVRVQTAGAHRLVPTLRTVNRKVVDGRRFEVLTALLGEETDGGTLLFVNTREQCDRLAAQLESAAIPFATYRGDMDPVERRDNLARFRGGEVRLLIATDLGARGLDVEGVARVVNYHMPSELESYLHRAGRTARAGRAGVVVNLVTERDEPLMGRLEKLKPRR